jgi:Icc-related predicted phosphoesterase
MKFLCLSDLHGHLPENLPPADITILGGDYMPDQDYQEEWSDYTLKPWLARLSKQTAIIAVAGNHDRLFEEKPVYAQSLDWIYLQDSGATIQGMEFWGIPWTYQDFPMAFSARTDFLEQAYAKIPYGVDVLISHGPPKDAGDLDSSGQRLGCQKLANKILAVQPRLVVCGHIHSGCGIFKLTETLVVNASIVDDERRLVRGPVEIELVRK